MTTPPTNPPAAGGDDLRPPFVEGDALDALLRDWHRDNRERAAAGRDRLLAALRSEDDAAAARAPAALEFKPAPRGPRPGLDGRWIVRFAPLAVAALVALAVVVPFLVPPGKSGGSFVALASAQSTILCPEAGRLEAFDAAGNSLGPCVLTHTDVAAEITGHVARVTLTQTFHNPHPDKIEAVYTFPLSHRGTVDRMSMTIGDRVIVGEVKERDRARDLYEAARDHDHVGALSEQDRSNVFTQSVTNIEPGTTVAVTLSYVEFVEEWNGEFSFVFPTVVEPRFVPVATNPGGRTPALPEGLKFRRGLVLLAPASIEITQRGPGFARSEPNPDAALLAAAIRGATPIEPPDSIAEPDRWCALDVRYADGTTERGLFYPPALGHVGGRWFTLAQPVSARAADAGRAIEPAPAPPATRSGHDLSISVTIDTGGPGILGIDTPLHRTTRADAMTNEQGLPRRSAVALANLTTIPNRDFVLNWRQSADAVTEQVFTHAGPRGNFFAIVLRPPARAGNGAAAGQPAPRRPVLSDLRVQFTEQLPVIDVLPPLDRLPDLYDDQPLVILGRYVEPGAGAVVIRGNTAAGPWRRTVTLDLPERRPEHDTIATLWARAKIEQIKSRDPAGVEDGTLASELRQEIVRIGERFGVMSEYTSFVAVDKLRMTVAGRPRLINVPVEPPVGTGDGGSVIAPNQAHDETWNARAADPAEPIPPIVRIDVQPGDNAPARSLGGEAMLKADVLAESVAAPPPPAPAAAAAPTRAAPAQDAARNQSRPGAAPAADSDARRIEAPAIQGAGQSRAENTPREQSANTLRSDRQANVTAPAAADSAADARPFSQVMPRDRQRATPRAGHAEQEHRQSRAQTDPGSNLFLSEMSNAVPVVIEDAANQTHVNLFVPREQVVLRVAQLAEQRQTDRARTLACELAQVVPDYPVALDLCNTLNEPKAPPEVQLRQVAAFAEQARRDLAEQARRAELRRRLDERLWLYVFGSGQTDTARLAMDAAACNNLSAAEALQIGREAGIEVRELSGGAAATGDALGVTVTVLVADTSPATLARLAAAGLRIEGSAPGAGVVVGAIALGRLGELAMTEGVRRIEPTPAE